MFRQSAKLTNSPSAPAQAKLHHNHGRRHPWQKNPAAVTAMAAENACWRKQKRGVTTRPHRVNQCFVSNWRRSAQPIAALIACCNRVFGCTPTNRSMTSPFLNSINVGMLLTP